MADVSQITADGVTYDIKDTVARAAMQNNVLTLTIGAFSTMPQTIYDGRITADMVVLSCTFGNPLAIASDITWATGAGYIQLNGTLSNTTTAVITLGKSSF